MSMKVGSLLESTIPCGRSTAFEDPFKSKDVLRMKIWNNHNSRQITPARDPKQCGDRKSVPDTSNSSYGTVTDQIRHYRNCSRKNLFWHKKQRYVYSSGPPTRNSYQDISENFKRSSKKDFLYRRSSYKKFLWASQKNPPSTNAEHLLEEDFNRISQDLLTRTCTGSCKDLYRISRGPLQDLLTRTCTRSCKGLCQHVTRISIRTSHKDLYKIMHCKDLLDIYPDLTPAFSTYHKNPWERDWSKKLIGARPYCGHTIRIWWPIWGIHWSVWKLETQTHSPKICYLLKGFLKIQKYMSHLGNSAFSGFSLEMLIDVHRFQ